MKYSLFALLLALGLTAGRAQAQEKPALNTSPVPPPAPAPAPQTTAPEVPVYTEPATQPPATPEPSTAPITVEPDADSPSGLQLPGREQARKAAQQQAEQNTRFFIYSGFGLGYNSYAGYSQFSGSLSPALGIRLTDRLAVGPGISYAYNNYGFSSGPYGNGPTTHISANNIGVKVFAQFRVIDQFFIHAEYESTRAQLLEADQYGNLTGRTVSRTVQTPLAGVGYRQQVSNRAAADIMILYNFQDDYNSIYPNPVVRFTFLFNIGK